MKDWIALNMTPGVGSRVTARLLEHFGSAEAIFDAPRRELALLRLPLETVESIVSRELHARAETEIESVRTSAAIFSCWTMVPIGRCCARLTIRGSSGT